jgi:hypothetical protein
MRSLKRVVDYSISGDLVRWEAAHEIEASGSSSISSLLR